MDRPPLSQTPTRPSDHRGDECDVASIGIAYSIWIFQYMAAGLNKPDGVSSGGIARALVWRHSYIALKPPHRFHNCTLHKLQQRYRRPANALLNRLALGVSIRRSNQSFLMRGRHGTLFDEFGLAPSKLSS